MGKIRAQRQSAFFSAFEFLDAESRSPAEVNRHFLSASCCSNRPESLTLMYFVPMRSFVADCGRTHLRLPFERRLMRPCATFSPAENRGILLAPVYARRLAKRGQQTRGLAGEYPAVVFIS